MTRAGMKSGWLALGAICLLVPLGAVRAQDAPEADTPISPYQQALLNYKNANYDAAHLAIDEAEKAKPNDPPTEILKARILIEQHQFDDARHVLESLDGNPAMTPAFEEAHKMVFGDLCLRQRHFDQATKYYQMLLEDKPDDADIILKLVYSRVGAGDLVAAGKYASQLKPLDPINPAYYFAKASLAEATGKSSEADEDIQTVRTIYGITVTNRYLKTYLQLSTSKPKDGLAPSASPPATNAPSKAL